MYIYLRNDDVHFLSKDLHAPATFASKISIWFIEKKGVSC